MKKSMINIGLTSIMLIALAGCSVKQPKEPIVIYKPVMQSGFLNSSGVSGRTEVRVYPKFDKLTKFFTGYIVVDPKNNIKIEDFERFIGDKTGAILRTYILGVVGNKIYYLNSLATSMFSSNNILQVYNLDTKTIESIAQEDEIIQFLKNGDDYVLKITDPKIPNSTRYISMNTLTEYSSISGAFSPIDIKTYNLMANGSLAEIKSKEYGINDLQRDFITHKIYGKFPIVFQ
jgi:translation elongation factor P/translation initiation factor 5A